MSPVDVFCPLMMFRVVREVDCAFVIHADRSWLRLLEAKFREESAQVYRFFSGLGGGDYLGFARGQSD
eukprot:5759590-Pleurochrysis_carterae.AAC.1